MAEAPGAVVAHPQVVSQLVRHGGGDDEDADRVVLRDGTGRAGHGGCGGDGERGQGVLTVLTPPERAGEHMELCADIPTETSLKRTPLGTERRGRGGPWAPRPQPGPHSREQLRVVVGQPRQQLLPAPAQEPLQRRPGAAAHRQAVAVAPDLHRQQGHPHPQRLEELGGTGGSETPGTTSAAEPST